MPRHPQTFVLLLNLIYNLVFLKALSLSSLDSLVIDEADLILSYGHDQDMRSVLSADNAYLPKVFQSFLMSATMTKDVEALKGLVLRNPATLRLEEDEDEARNLVQYAVRYDISKPLPHLMAACSIAEPTGPMRGVPIAPPPRCPIPLASKRRHLAYTSTHVCCSLPAASDIIAYRYSNWRNVTEPSLWLMRVFTLSIHGLLCIHGINTRPPIQ